MLSMRMAFSLPLTLAWSLAPHQKNIHKTSLLHMGFTPSNLIMSGRTICGHSFRWVPLLSFLSFCFAFVCVLCAHFVSSHLFIAAILMARLVSCSSMKSVGQSVFQSHTRTRTAIFQMCGTHKFNRFAVYKTFIARIWDSFRELIGYKSANMESIKVINVGSPNEFLIATRHWLPIIVAFPPLFLLLCAHAQVWCVSRYAHPFFKLCDRMINEVHGDNGALFI